MLYIINLFYYGRKEEPLIADEKFQAWDYGPVLPTLYHKLKKYGPNNIKSDNIEKVFGISSLTNDSDEYTTIKEVSEGLEKFETSQLIAVTHRSGGAWSLNYERSQNNIIKDEDIKQEYLNYYKKA